MTADDRERRTARFPEAAAARTADAAARARRAITRLHATRQPITFVSVARTAGVSTSFLYQHPELRREVGEHRTRERGPAQATARNSAAPQHNPRRHPPDQLLLTRSGNCLMTKPTTPDTPHGFVGPECPASRLRDRGTGQHTTALMVIYPLAVIAHVARRYVHPAHVSALPAARGSRRRPVPTSGRVVRVRQ